MHPQAKEKPGRKPLTEIKLMKDDAAAVEKTSDEIKARYTKIFKVWTGLSSFPSPASGRGRAV